MAGRDSELRSTKNLQPHGCRFFVYRAAENPRLPGGQGTFTRPNFFIGVPGIEPGLRTPEARVLPIYYTPVKKFRRAGTAACPVARACPAPSFALMLGYYHYPPA